MEVSRFIQTERLDLRAASVEQSQVVYEAIRDSLDDLRPWISWATVLPSVRILEEVSLRAAQMFETREAFIWRIYLKGGDSFVGEIDLHSWDWDVPKCEMGYWANSRYTRQGYIREAIRAVLGVAFAGLEVRRVEALCDARNERSIRLAQRSGMVREGVLRNYELDPSGELCDQVLLSMIPEDYGRLI
jgi:ribosomal-protein-serine acetyltransferase